MKMIATSSEIDTFSTSISRRTHSMYQMTEFLKPINYNTIH